MAQSARPPSGDGDRAVIPLRLPAACDADAPYVTRLGSVTDGQDGTCRLERESGDRSLWSGRHGLLEIVHNSEQVAGDVVLVDPGSGHVERLIRATSGHNTFLVTEQCDQLCVMCSQPPKKTHHDRFAFFEQACLLADHGVTIGISGGEPTLHKAKLLDMIETVLARRPDLSFHVLTNGQHFARCDVERLRQSVFRRVVWGIPIYAADPGCHDAIVGKSGAFERLLGSFRHLVAAAARIELRTVLLSRNADKLDGLAGFVADHLPQIEQWSLMDLENAGFARARFRELRIGLADGFAELAPAIDRALLHGLPVRLFNVPLCHIPESYRHLAVASISDWKQRFADACGACRARDRCAGFFEWHPDDLVEKVHPL